MGIFFFFFFFFTSLSGGSLGFDISEMIAVSAFRGTDRKCSISTMHGSMTSFVIANFRFLNHFIGLNKHLKNSGEPSSERMQRSKLRLSINFLGGAFRFDTVSLSVIGVTQSILANR